MTLMNCMPTAGCDARLWAALYGPGLPLWVALSRLHNVGVHEPGKQTDKSREENNVSSYTAVAGCCAADSRAISIL